MINCLSSYLPDCPVFKLIGKTDWVPFGRRAPVNFNSLLSTSFVVRMFCRRVQRSIHYFDQHCVGLQKVTKSFLNGPFPASFSLFSSFLDTNWQINTFEILLMSGFELRISGVGSNRSANCAATTAPWQNFTRNAQSRIEQIRRLWVRDLVQFRLNNPDKNGEWRNIAWYH